MISNTQQTDVRQQEAALVEREKTEAYPASTPATFTGDHAPEEGVGGTNGITESERKTHYETVYRVTSTVYGLRHGGLYDHVNINWFCVHRSYPFVRPEEAITDYDENKYNSLHAREYLSEHFSRKEAVALKDYLSRFKGVTRIGWTTISKVDLPISNFPMTFKEQLSDSDPELAPGCPRGMTRTCSPSRCRDTITCVGKCQGRFYVLTVGKK